MRTREESLGSTPQQAGDYCKMWCGGVLRSIKPPPQSDPEYFKILDERDRRLYLSMVGHEPLEARIALVGLNPAFSQLTEFIKRYGRTGDFDKSKKESAFSNQNLRRNLIKMLDFLKVQHFWGLNHQDGSRGASKLRTVINSTKHDDRRSWIHVKGDWKEDGHSCYWANSREYPYQGANQNAHETSE